MSLNLICKSAQSAEQISHAQFEQAHVESGSSASINNNNFQDHSLSQDSWIFWRAGAKVMFVNVNTKAQSKFSAQVWRHIKFTKEDQRQKAKKGCTSQGKKPKGSTSPGAKVNGNKCNRRQVYEQCKQLCNQTNVWLSNNRDLESAVFLIGRSVMTIISQMRCFTTQTQE